MDKNHRAKSIPKSDDVPARAAPLANTLTKGHSACQIETQAVTTAKVKDKMRLTTFTVGSGLLAFVQLVAAFSDTTPLLAYSSAESSFDRLRVAKRNAPGPSALYSRDVARTLIKESKKHVCGLDGIALIEVEDVSTS